MKDFNKLMIGALFISPLILSQSVSAVESEATPDPSRSTGAIVNFIPNDGPVNPVDPEHPKKDVEPVNPDGTLPEAGTAGPLSLDFAPMLSFGKNKISTRDETYYATAQKLLNNSSTANGGHVPTWVQVTDNRGTLKGWTLGMKQNGQFKSVTTETILTGAEISFRDAATTGSMAEFETPRPSFKESFSLNPDGMGVVENIMIAEEGQGAGTWTYYFGSGVNFMKSINPEDPEGALLYRTDVIKLTVPGSTNKLLEQYKTSLTWTLSSLPGNK